MFAQSQVRPTIAEVLSILERRTLTFAARELNLPARVTDCRPQGVDSLRLRDVTALVSLGPCLDLYIAYSFAGGLISRITGRFIAELDLPPEDEPNYVQESARELVNIIVGNSTAELERDGGALHLSPPSVLIGSRQIPHRPGVEFGIVSLGFEAGDLDIACLGPQHLFDSALNYIG